MPAKASRPKRYVAVIGGGDADAEACALAEAVGRGLAHADAVVVCGGLGGVMEAACRGAKSAGGTTVGILPADRRDAANEFVDIAIATGLGEARNAIVVRTADVLVAVAGEFGTLSEIALGLRAGKPVIGLRTWELVRDGQPVGGVIRATDPDDAVALAVAAAGAAG
jgi:uncharacterized protein (TIGR00725 family)